VVILELFRLPASSVFCDAGKACLPQEPWQVFKAFHSARQKWDYHKMAWAAREQKRQGRSKEEIKKALAKKDPAYKAGSRDMAKIQTGNFRHRVSLPGIFRCRQNGTLEAGAAGKSSRTN
jgi:hypothetical protein